jgi:hypothetical protein
MRKSKNYYKFMEYMAFGISGWHEDAVMVDNGVIEYWVSRDDIHKRLTGESEVLACQN